MFQFLQMVSVRPDSPIRIIRLLHVLGEVRVYTARTAAVVERVEGVGVSAEEADAVRTALTNAR